MQFYNFKPITNFYYSIGEAKTDVPWFRPDPQYLNKWKEEFFRVPITSKYRYIIHGSAIQNSSKTWDVDISIIGPGAEEDYPDLELVMYAMRQIGFKHRQLIEPFWQDLPIEIYNRGPCDHFEISCDTFLDKNSCTLEECLSTPAAQFKSKKRIRYGQIVVKGGEEFHVPDPIFDGSGTEVSRNGELIVTNIIDPSGPWPKKVVEKMKKGIFKAAPVEITVDTDFRDIISWP